jgi:hypothetical protein
MYHLAWNHFHVDHEGYYELGTGPNRCLKILFCFTRIMFEIAYWWETHAVLHGVSRGGYSFVFRCSVMPQWSSG